ncbi:hypothetical protein COO60DRAFT_303 [Scenedesmus sp. NREL 46B-D3]|nr:hypothetical protein COO60DRAFT_303 [Scenedesmus sp. NREL 46B-D3]
MYCPNPPPADPVLFYWRGRDGCVHDRHGNKWDTKTKVLLQAGSGEAGAAKAAGPDAKQDRGAGFGAGRGNTAGGSRSNRASSPELSHSTKRQRRDSAPGCSVDGGQAGNAGAAAAAVAGLKRPGQQLQQQGPGSCARGSGNRPGRAQPQAAPATLGDSWQAAAAGSGSAGLPAARPRSSVLPEELDVDMEVDDAPGPTGAAGAQRQQPGKQQQGRDSPAAVHGSTGRQFGRRPPPLLVSAAAAEPGRGGDRGQGSAGGAAAGARTPTRVAPLSPGPVLGSPAAAARASLVEAGHCNAEYQAVALEVLQHNLSTLDTASFKSSVTLELEASTLKSSAAKLAASHGWDVRALLLHLSSGMKYLEWAHSFAGSGGVGVASISKQQAYKNNLSEAAGMVRSCAKLAKQQMVQRASQRKAGGAAAPPAMTALDYAFAAVRLLADKLDAVASMCLLFVKTQGFNTTLRNLTLGTSPAATAAVAAAAAADAAGTGGAAAAGGAGGVAAGGPGLMAAPAARAPGGRAGGRGQLAGPSPGESGTQNSASSAVELVPVAAEGSSRANDRADLADGVQEYITLTDHWAAVADANEAYLQKTGRAAAAAAAAEAAADAKARSAAEAAAAPGGAGEAGAAAAPLLPHPPPALLLAAAVRSVLLRWLLPTELAS